MGSGCSSPLKRLGGKRGKPTRRESSPYEANGEQDLNGQAGTNTGIANTDDQLSNTPKPHDFIIDNEVTIQSEMNDEHQSTTSCYTNGKNLIDETTKISERSASLDPRSGVASSGNTVARMIVGPNGNYTPHDRHLLVSPALSPAPSSCYSPSPASSNHASISTMDYNEAFTILTFGLHNLNSEISNKPKYESQNSLQIQQLIQTHEDLINHISVIFVASDQFNHKTQTTIEIDSKQTQTSNIEWLANQIETDLKTYCDEHLFKLRFLNISQAHLSEHFHINNIVDVSMNIFEKEFKENSQRIVVIAIANNNNQYNIGTTYETDGKQCSILDKRQLPTLLEAQIMNRLKILNNFNEQAKELLKRWYNQVGNVFYLNPIYVVYPEILDGSNEERDAAWTKWLNESNHLLQCIDTISAEEPDLIANIRFKSVFGSCIDYINKEPALQKRTLLIRGLSLSNSTGTANHPQQSASNLNRDANINELARLLADPNKLTLKRQASDKEYQKTIVDWISDSFGKFIESFIENKIAQGKHVPPFTERNLFTELTVQRGCFEYYINNITETSMEKYQNFYTNQIAPMIDDVLSIPDLSDERRSSSSPLPSANHLVFISGPKGCGKSTLFAQILKLSAQDLMNKAQIIYRFCSVSIDSLNPNRLLRSVCEQFCQSQGENITAASYIYSSRNEIMNALNKITKSRASLLFIDGLDKLHITNDCDLDWLCELEAASRLKIFITLETNSKLYEKVLSSYSDATHISLDSPPTSEWAQMLATTMKSKRFNSLGNLYEDIKTTATDSNKKSFIQASDIINLCRIRKLNNEGIYPELTARSLQVHLNDDFKSLRPAILQHLQYLLTPYQLCSLFVIFKLSRNGLSDSDITNIMTIVSQTAKIHSPDVRFSSTLLYYLKIQLQPWTKQILYGKMIKTSIHRDFMLDCIEHYSSTRFPSVIEDIREILVEYFNRQSKTKSSKGSLIKLGENPQLTDIREQVSLSERSWLATQASETINLMLSSNPVKAKDHILNKHQFFRLFLYGSMPEEFIEDFDKMKDLLNKKSHSSMEELQQLVNYIRQSVYPLRYDGSQIYSQIYCKSYESIKSGKVVKGKKLSEILNISATPPIRSLLPISEASINSFIRTRIGQNQQLSSSSSANLISSSTLNNEQKPATKLSTNSNNYQQSNQIPGRQRIYTIRDNHRHVIVIYPDKDCLSVWDIFEEKAVRTINNLDQPRDLKMIDQKRAVILCNRELRVYDLNSGILLTKLKGVMNQKMPFFEVFGDNYVVALARNRMYVNMLNLNTGELETTFKVGEDRFLNSLLVSANGGICVCGDETQKPFPLLVWNLNERRLMYDLRLERHEFLTKMSAISDDGHFFVTVCRQLGDGDNSASNSANNSQIRRPSPDFIVVYDLNSGTLFKKWKPGLDSCNVAISLSSNRSGKVINTLIDSSILIWDLVTGSKRHTLIGHSAPADVISVQSSRLFSMDSTCRDQSLRIWDIEEGYCLAVFSPDAPINCCQISIRGDALICGFAAETRLSTLVMCKNETVNEFVKRNKRRKSSRSIYIFDEPPSRKSSS